MSKSPYLFLVLFLLGLTAGAQLNTIETDEQIVRRLILRGADLPPGMTDSPYDNEEFQSGLYIIRDTTQKRALLRYNAYKDNIEIQDDGQVYSLFKRPYISAVINGDTFKIYNYRNGKGEQKQGYLIQLTEGPVKLLKRKSKIFQYGTQGDGYTKAKPPRFEDKTEYYLLSGDEIANPIKLRKKTILEALGNTKEANSIVKELKLNLGKEDDVIQLLNALNG